MTVQTVVLEEPFSIRRKLPTILAVLTGMMIGGKWFDKKQFKKDGFIWQMYFF